MIKVSAIMASLSAILALSQISIEPQYEPKAAIVMEVESGEILYQHNINEKLPLASTAKLMTVYVALKEVQANKRQLSDHFITTKHNVEISQLPEISTNYMIEGKSYSLEDLIKLNLIVSSNAASIMLAENLYGSESDFVAKMNEYAQSFQMQDTRFVNSTGLVNKDTQSYTKNQLEGESTSTAYDYAKFVRALMTEFPEIVNYTRIKNTTITPDTNPEELNSTYKKFLDKSDDYVGLKTGVGEHIGNNFVALSQYNNKNYVVILFGVGPYLSDTSVRFDIAHGLWSMPKRY